MKYTSTLDHIAANIPHWELERLLKQSATEAVTTSKSGRLLAARINTLFGRALQARCPAARIDWSHVAEIVGEQVAAKNALVA